MWKVTISCRISLLFPFLWRLLGLQRRHLQAGAGITGLTAEGRIPGRGGRSFPTLRPAPRVSPFVTVFTSLCFY
ncbi:hypothetical protein GDO81_026610 [Engystomops pustulosus]|uniref:Secreted protein n=1 Tax=Engystomops pustulosus TaxID=76066 RepID=A0AAV6ZQ64_ENGPU|nr:hypothetical protein GDO81_026610 [Engystomops pustulosus]